MPRHTVPYRYQIADTNYDKYKINNVNLNDPTCGLSVGVGSWRASLGLGADMYTASHREEASETERRNGNGTGVIYYTVN
jgi:hypothetical protein